MIVIICCVAWSTHGRSCRWCDSRHSKQNALRKTNKFFNIMVDVKYGRLITRVSRSFVLSIDYSTLFFLVRSLALSLSLIPFFVLATTNFQNMETNAMKNLFLRAHEHRRRFIFIYWLLLLWTATMHTLHFVASVSVNISSRRFFTQNIKKQRQTDQCVLARVSFGNGVMVLSSRARFLYNVQHSAVDGTTSPLSRSIK